MKGRKFNINGLEIDGTAPITPRTQAFLTAHDMHVEQNAGFATLTGNFSLNSQEVQAFLASKGVQQTTPAAPQAVPAAQTRPVVPQVAPQQQQTIDSTDFGMTIDARLQQADARVQQAQALVTEQANPVVPQVTFVAPQATRVAPRATRTVPRTAASEAQRNANLAKAAEYARQRRP